ncbi:MAG: MarR family transcriptional regulator [bacterium]
MKNISLLGHPIITMHKICFLNEKIQDHWLKKKLNLSLAQYMILIFLSLKPGLSQEDIAQRRNCTEASVSRIIRIMAEKKFITSRSAVGDKRKKELFLSDRGRKLLVRAKNIVNQEFGLILQKVGQEEENKLKKSLDKILLTITDRAHKLSVIRQEKQ